MSEIRELRALVLRPTSELRGMWKLQFPHYGTSKKAVELCFVLLTIICMTWGKRRNTVLYFATLELVEALGARTYAHTHHTKMKL